MVSLRYKAGLVGSSIKVARLAGLVALPPNKWILVQFSCHNFNFIYFNNTPGEFSNSCRA